MDFFKRKDLYKEIWQCPTVLIPIQFKHHNASQESLVIRPVISIDAMTADVYPLKRKHLQNLESLLRKELACSAVFYDLTTKPPGTIEWE